jgi:hypothetical protein
MVDGGLGWSVEELTRLTRPPSSESGIKFKIGQVAQHTCHDNRAIAPLSKGKVKLVVFDIVVASDIVGVDATAGEVLSNGFSDGRFLRYTEDFLWHLSFW